MTTLSEQCIILRSWAAQFDERADFDALAPLLASDLREAADTIISLRKQIEALEGKWKTKNGSGTCKIIATATNNLMYPDYMTKWYKLSCGHSLTLKGEEGPKWCAVCGKEIE